MTPKQWLARRRAALASHDIPADIPAHQRSYMAHHAGEPFRKARRAAQSAIDGRWFTDPEKSPVGPERDAAEERLAAEWARDGAAALKVYRDTYLRAKGLKP